MAYGLAEDDVNGLWCDPKESGEPAFGILGIARAHADPHLDDFAAIDFKSGHWLLNLVLKIVFCRRYTVARDAQK